MNKHLYLPVILTSFLQGVSKHNIKVHVKIITVSHISTVTVNITTLNVTFMIVPVYHR